ncbi:hypothetical protein PUR71_24610 [Streptomyces sp. SP17BM10]|uniref:hypothetical protein n=1 Tax=Streptomyces sp. SP17BM10 TaxID=3002530 RepID=UPI002E75B34D|nr:hypothetical protein [Streptomyces sp. SP17BM10]MEE1786054.1 hypothetical protein [Streptomyces sp. SP17BM10]
MPRFTVVNITPKSLSGESEQDSEPFLAVNPEKPAEMVATAFTPAPLHGKSAPVYVSTDGGATWSLNTIVPGGGAIQGHGFGTGDITVAFADRGGTLYAGILNGVAAFLQDRTILQILRTPSVTSTAPMKVLVNRDPVDQPWVVADTVAGDGGDRDRVFIGNNNFAHNPPSPRTATVDVSGDARAAAGPAGFAPAGIERRTPAQQDGPPVRLALHPDGTVYAAFESWTTDKAVSQQVSDVTFDVVVTRDDSAAAGTDPFQDLKDATDSTPGQRVATGCFVVFGGGMGQERMGGDLTIAVDPTDANNVWIAWCDRVGGPKGIDNTLHVRRSTDRGQSWAKTRDDLTDVKNPALAVNSQGVIGLAYQKFADNQWTTILETTADSWRSAPETTVLHQAPADVPQAVGLPYLGDYIRLLAVGADFYGIFSGNNTPDNANFPVGVSYQRNADFTTHRLLDVDGTPGVPVSIDPFFFHRAA